MLPEVGRINHLRRQGGLPHRRRKGFIGGDCSQRSCPLGYAWTDHAVAVDNAHHLTECANNNAAPLLSHAPAPGPGGPGPSSGPGPKIETRRQFHSSETTEGIERKSSNEGALPVVDEGNSELLICTGKGGICTFSAESLK
jgi:hypothetical protein